MTVICGTNLSVIEKRSFDFASIDANNVNYWNDHKRLLKLVKVGGLAIYNNTSWGGSVATPEDAVGKMLKEG